MSALHKLSRRDETLSSKLDENSVNDFTLSIIRKIIDLQENIKYAHKNWKKSLFKAWNGAFSKYKLSYLPGFLVIEKNCPDFARKMFKSTSFLEVKRRKPTNRISL